MKHAEIAHSMPGRVRLRIPAARHNPELLEEIRQALAGLPGLQRTRLKPEAGSIVLRYDIAEAAAFEAWLTQQGVSVISLPQRDLYGGPPQPGGEIGEMASKIKAEAEFLADHSQVARAIFDFVKQVDREVRIATNNTIDLKIVVALALAVVTFAGIGVHASTPMWVTLALFAVNHFVELHSSTQSAAARHAKLRVIA
jgi:hypothetical protein